MAERLAESTRGAKAAFRSEGDMAVGTDQHRTIRVDPVNGRERALAGTLDEIAACADDIALQPDAAFRPDAAGRISPGRPPADPQARQSRRKRDRSSTDPDRPDRTTTDAAPALPDAP